MDPIMFNSNNKKEVSVSSTYTTAPQSVSAIPLIFSNQANPKTTNTVDNSIFTVQNIFGPFLESKQPKDNIITEIPGWAVYKDDQGRQESLNKYLEKFPTKEAQYAEVQRLLAKAQTPNDVTFLTGALGRLRPENQVSAVNSMLDNQNLTSDVKIVSDIGVANNVPKLTSENQLPALQAVVSTVEAATNREESETAKALEEHRARWASLTPSQRSAFLRGGARLASKEIAKDPAGTQLTSAEIIAHSNNEQALITVASKISQLAPENQIAGAGIVEKAKTSDDTKKVVDKTIIDQYGKFAKENQLGVHEIMSASKFSEIVEYAAANAWQFDKENQFQAIEITKATKNEAAINAAASQIDKYSDKYQAQIRASLSGSGYESVNNTLIEAEKQARAERESETKAEEQRQASVQENTSESVKADSTEEKIQVVKDLIKNKDTASLKESVKNLSEVETIALLKQCPNMSVIKAIMQNNPSLDVLAQISEIIKDEKSLKEMGYKTLLPQLVFMGAGAQRIIIQKSSQEGTLGSISRDILQASVKEEYDKLTKKG